MTGEELHRLRTRWHYIWRKLRAIRHIAYEHPGREFDAGYCLDRYTAGDKF